MRFALLLLWLGGTIWGIGQIAEGAQTGNGGQVMLAIVVGVICTYVISIIFNLAYGRKWTGAERG